MATELLSSSSVIRDPISDAFAVTPIHGGFATPTLARLMLHADWRLGSRLRLFGQLASAQEGSNPRGAV